MTEMQKEFEDAIKKQNSILEKTELLFKELDEENMTFSITYLIIPKAISDNTKLYLTISGEKKPMKQDGIVFSHTETYGLFEAIAQPYVVIEDGHSSNLEQMAVLQLERLSEAIFPAMNIDIEDTKVMIREKYQRVGTIQYDNKPSEFFPEGIRYTSSELVVLHDDTVVASYPVNLSQRQVAINVLVDVKKGQTATMMIVLKDNLNLEHRYLLERYTPGSSKLIETYHGHEKYLSKWQVTAQI